MEKLSLSLARALSLSLVISTTERQTHTHINTRKHTQGCSKGPPPVCTVSSTPMWTYSCSNENVSAQIGAEAASVCLMPFFWSSACFAQPYHNFMQSMFSAFVRKRERERERDRSERERERGREREEDIFVETVPEIMHGLVCGRGKL